MCQNTLEEMQWLQQATSLIQLKTPEVSRLDFFNTLPFQLDHRDRSLLFHCKPLLLIVALSTFG
jgi:hypothetical protein